ncbi:type 1 fimbria pilin [Enterobacillus tribolii]|uniref:Type 1 fimbria pilin n=2 Tax=Enterobacillus tribolii TaxID=1487935 RepID=A0A370QQU6_9GAMM|nr:type 1 fimbria pilin [Enterobacillus tribolii]
MIMSDRLLKQAPDMKTVNSSLRRLVVFCGLAAWGTLSHAYPIEPYQAGEYIPAPTMPFIWSSHITDPDTNQAGQYPVQDAELSSTSSGYGGMCVPASACPYVSSSQPPFTGTYFRATIGNLAGKEVAQGSNGLRYFQVNENLAVGIKFYTQQNRSFRYIPIPYDNINNGVGPSTRPPYPYLTGTSAQMSLYIIKPFIGESEIPETLVSELFAATVADGYSANPVARVSLQGKITVDQSCNFTAGQVLPTIDFGNMLATDFKTKGTGPANAEKKINLAIKCTNISNGVKFKMKLQGTPDAASPEYLATGNSNIGIKFVEDQSGAQISPSGGVFPAAGALNFDFSDPLNPTGSTAIRVSPVSSTGVEPQKGTFDATATISVSLE